EYAALRWAAQRGVEARFIDLPVGVALAALAEEDTASSDSVDDLDVEGTIAARLGARSFEEAWEAHLEAPAHDARGWSAAITAYAELIRGGGRRRARERDAVMA